MAKRELSNTLKNLKFMQRASQKEEKPKKEEEISPAENFVSPGTQIKQRCLVIMEGDPHPGAVRGRMSFCNFNPLIDKLNEALADSGQSEGSPAPSGLQSGRAVNRENDDPSKNGPGIPEAGSHGAEADGELKRKQSPVSAEHLHPNKLQKNGKGVSEPSSRSNKQPKRERLDWNVLRPSKGQGKRGTYLTEISGAQATGNIL